ncbi:hypothetical protein LCGC14_2421440 [marine sediment metagenome]|uniref:Uncharacterized protein n=1 Tax=marine sediment metagenome TaxID=412755 RepID=A0A0F9CBS3_9ZZZZ
MTDEKARPPFTKDEALRVLAISKNFCDKCWIGDPNCYDDDICSLGAFKGWLQKTYEIEEEEEACVPVPISNTPGD